ncbi:hypothetical protein PV11_09046 [Exophiala sideris]|uniref:Uncharacterized protein n=1 Tax=Exophiala sideris TaxID=1016849 RepID=A0A0D1WQ70_9EURO|nr:hypothetical protein PV11_09046 [Exophiala sideris]
MKKRQSQENEYDSAIVGGVGAIFREAGSHFVVADILFTTGLVHCSPEKASVQARTSARTLSLVLRIDGYKGISMERVKTTFGGMATRLATYPTDHAGKLKEWHDVVVVLLVGTTLTLSKCEGRPRWGQINGIHQARKFHEAIYKERELTARPCIGRGGNSGGLCRNMSQAFMNEAAPLLQNYASALSDDERASHRTAFDQFFKCHP